ncbi:Structural maintenance of chromosomes protein 4 [Spiromyces aspiralis]|uniref:Structural maintenance of chromosomes protein 4 n=1 Tax=Spiromyces aspiralis TaxID=68401 RepID=A0ACC1HKI1_9FUNG|nr:Structural maintenance of chromosomes protein 4 [Spiromyces aspiralis]
MEIESQGDDQDAEANKGPAKNSDSSDPKLPTFTEEELRELNISALVKQIGQLEARVQGAKPNLSILSEYRERSRDYRAKKRACDEITARRDEAQVHYDNLRKRRLDEFMTGFNTISYKLKEMYQMITMGGNAELELVDSLDPFSEGIVFSVMPPKKSWKNIANLSGGEKTLSSLALVFALHQFKPTPIYVMDEIDAALDFRNVSIVANYIREQTRDAQFVIISLRNNMFELADRLIGIYKTDSRTKSIAINPNASAHLLAAAAASNKDGTLSATRAAASVGGAASTAS